MTASSDEREIRHAVVLRLRGLFPNARIVHELNVAGQGSNRIDVAAINETSIIAVEIKSKKDTLKRLDQQILAFKRCCHFVFVAAHEKHFVEWRDKHWRDDVPAESFLSNEAFIGHYHMDKHVWRFPQPLVNRRPWNTFNPNDDLMDQPRAKDILEMLWADELRAECSRHNISASAKTTRPQMIRDMAWLMTGKEVCQAVCRQLRGRGFAEADAPIFDVRTAA